MEFKVGVIFWLYYLYDILLIFLVNFIYLFFCREWKVIEGMI